jgi:hypothetical protein
MKFDISAYKASRDRVIQLIKASHDWEKTEGFIADGVINPDVYALQPVRILCVLAESYGYEECGMLDIETQPHSDLLGLANPEVKTPRRIAALLHLLLLSAERAGEKVPEEEWHQMPRLLSTDGPCVSIHQETLSKIAWINIKKASNPDGTELKSAVVRAHSQRNKAVLQEQIESIRPHLVLICGQDAFGSLLQMGLLGPEARAGNVWQLQRMRDDARLIEVSHPAFFPEWGSYAALYQSYTRIHDQCRRDPAFPHPVEP